MPIRPVDISQMTRVYSGRAGSHQVTVVSGRGLLWLRQLPAASRAFQVSQRPVSLGDKSSPLNLKIFYGGLLPDVFLVCERDVYRTFSSPDVYRTFLVLILVRAFF